MPEDEWRIEEAELAIGSNDYVAAQHILESYLIRHPHDDRARAMLADVDAVLHLRDAPPQRRRAQGEPRKRTPPLGVVVIAAIDAFFGALFVLLGFVLFLAGAPAGLLIALMGGGMLAIARGLWRLRDWAWWLSIVLGGIGLLLDVVRLWSPAIGTRGETPLVVVRLIVNLVVLAYLLHVAEAFGTRTRKPPRAAAAGFDAAFDAAPRPPGDDAGSAGRR